MTELKTLKDIEVEWDEDDRDLQPNEAEDRVKEELKKEAIKWVKEDMKDYDLLKLNAGESIFRLMKRFNITQQELTKEDLNG